MKEAYREPQMEIVCILTEDVVTASVPVTPIDPANPDADTANYFPGGWN